MTADEERAEIEALRTISRMPSTYSVVAAQRVARAALDRVRDARDDEAIQLGDQAAPEEGDWPRAARSPQGEDREAGAHPTAWAYERACAALAACKADLHNTRAELQALVDWFNDAPFPRAEQLLRDQEHNR